MQTTSPELTNQPTTPRASDHGEYLTVEVTEQTRVIAFFPRSSTLPTSFVNAKLRV